MAEFRIRFITESDPISDLIRFVTFSEWSHVEIITETGTYIGAHADGGIEERAADYCKPNHERRYAIPVTDEQYATMMAYARSKIGTPYNFKDIVGLMLHHRMTEVKRSICSQFVEDVGVSAKFLFLNVEPDFDYLITPETLHLSPKLIGNCYFKA
jgi:hypothetical protein